MRQLLLFLVLAVMAGCNIDHSEKFTKIVRNAHSGLWAIETGIDKSGAKIFVGINGRIVGFSISGNHAYMDTVINAKPPYECRFDDSLACVHFIEAKDSMYNFNHKKDSIRFAAKHISDSIEKLNHTYK